MTSASTPSSRRSERPSCRSPDVASQTDPPSTTSSPATATTAAGSGANDLSDLFTVSPVQDESCPPSSGKHCLVAHQAIRLIFLENLHFSRKVLLAEP